MLPRLETLAPPGGASFLCRRRRDPRFEFAWHVHPEVELTWIVRSRGRRFVGDSIEDYRDGDLVLLGPELPHTWASDRGGGRHEAVVVQFAPAFLGPPFLASPELLGVRRLLDRAAQGLRFEGRTQREAARAMDALERSRGLPRLRGLLGVLDLLAGARGRPLSSRSFTPTLRRPDRERIDRVCRFLNARFAEPVSLADAAAAAHLSPPAFCRFFRRKTGKTLVGYLNELRVGRACRLLLETDQPVSGICFASGFGNLSNFNRRFRALKGLSPREFRIEFRGREGGMRAPR